MSLLAEKRPLRTKCLIVLLLGPPGAGKGTHAATLVQKLSLPHISTGDLFRENIHSKTPLGIEADRYISLGQLVPDAIALDMLFQRLARPDCQKGCILDGFPRTIPQAEEFDRRLGETTEAVALYFDADEATLVERIAGRISCRSCGRSYHRTFHPPQGAHCDHCSGPLHQREDDGEEVVRKRLEVYRRQTKPVVDYYSQKSGMLRKISAVGDKERIFQDILDALGY